MTLLVRIQVLVLKHCWSIATELFDHPPYSPDLPPSDCHLFTYLKNWLGSQRFNSNEELINGRCQNVAELNTEAYQ
jgi:histone-lysine N-methyltransferase SETMAR